MNLCGGGLEATGIQTLGQICETFVLISLPFLLARLGIKRVLVIGMGAWAVRFVLFGFGYQDDTAIMPMLLLGIIIHGICYDFLIVSGQIYVDRKFDPESRARAQAFLTLIRSEEHTSELQSLMRISYAVFCLKKKNTEN